MSKKERVQPETPQKSPTKQPENKDDGKFLTDDSQPMIKKIFGMILIVIIPVILLVICLAFKIGIIPDTWSSSSPQNNQPPICAGMDYVTAQPSRKGEPVIVGKVCLSAKIYLPKGEHKMLVGFPEGNSVSYYLDDNGKLTGPFLSPPNTGKEFDFGNHPFRMMGFDGVATIYLL